MVTWQEWEGQKRMVLALPCQMPRVLQDILTSPQKSCQSRWFSRLPISVLPTGPLAYTPMGVSLPSSSPSLLPLFSLPSLLSPPLLLLFFVLSPSLPPYLSLSPFVSLVPSFLPSFLLSFLPSFPVKTAWLLKSNFNLLGNSGYFKNCHSLSVGF